MKNLKLLLVALLTVVFTPKAWADDETAIVDGIQYSGVSAHSSSVKALWVVSRLPGPRFDIPSNITVDGKSYKVTSISADFWNDGDSEYTQDIKELHIPPTVADLETSSLMSFSGFNNMRTLVFDEGDSYLTKLPAGLFNGLRIETLVLPSSLKEIGSDCFYGCEYLNNITINRNDQNTEPLLIG